MKQTSTTPNTNPLIIVYAKIASYSLLSALIGATVDSLIAFWIFIIFTPTSTQHLPNNGTLALTYTTDKHIFNADLDFESDLIVVDDNLQAHLIRRDIENTSGAQWYENYISYVTQDSAENLLTPYKEIHFQDTKNSPVVKKIQLPNKNIVTFSNRNPTSTTDDITSSTSEQLTLLDPLIAPKLKINKEIPGYTLGLAICNGELYRHYTETKDVPYQEINGQYYNKPFIAHLAKLDLQNPLEFIDITTTELPADRIFTNGLICNNNQLYTIATFTNYNSTKVPSEIISWNLQTGKRHGIPLNFAQKNMPSNNIGEATFNNNKYLWTSSDYRKNYLYETDIKTGTTKKKIETDEAAEIRFINNSPVILTNTQTNAERTVQIKWYDLNTEKYYKLATISFSNNLIDKKAYLNHIAFNPQSNFFTSKMLLAKTNILYHKQINTLISKSR